MLTGDGLLTDAFALMLAAEGIKAEHAREAALEIARGAGSLGMVGGQADDTLNVSNAKEPTLDELDRINDRKTGALISAACRGGLLLGGTSDPRLLNAAGVYAQNLGRAFQITDDILDIGGGQQLGKTAGSDKRLGKHICRHSRSGGSAKGARADRKRNQGAVGLQRAALSDLADQKPVRPSALARYIASYCK